MAEIKEVHVPDVGDTDGITVAEILVGPGDTVAVDDALLTLESDKASMEVPSPTAGTVREVKVNVGDEVQEGSLILTLEVAPAAAEDEKSSEAAPVPRPPEGQDQPAASAQASTVQKSSTQESASQDSNAQVTKPPAPKKVSSGTAEIDEEAFAKAYASPTVRRLARELGVDLGRVPGTGRKGRITKEDIQEFVKAALAGGTIPVGASGGGSVGGFEWPAMPQIDYASFGPVETEPLSRIGKVSARNLHRSWLHVPHVTQHDETDITEMEAFRKAQADEAKQKGFKLTPLAFLLKASAAALKEFPRFNASLDPNGENLILKGYFNIGVAVDTPNGLVVPVIRDVDRKSLYELAAEVVGAGVRAREGKLTPKDFQGGCFTISSLGGIGGTAFTPIVNAPEVAILGVSRSQMKPIWQGGEFVPRLMLPLSLSYDHRVIDGASAARFVVYLGHLLNDIRRLLL